jgi:protein O-mannosyl-transferase
MIRLRNSQGLQAALLVAALLASYGPTLQAGFVWDDDSNLTANFNLRDLEGLGRIWTNAAWNQQQYYPLTHTTFWLEYHLWGLEPRGYHLVNVALHAAAALLLWRILRLLGVPGAWLAAALFALHPLQVESVAWVTERKNTLSGVFYLASALAGLHFAGVDGRNPVRGAPAPRRWRWYVLCLFLFLCALLAKSATSVLPVALAIAIWWRSGKVRLRELAALLPLMVFGAVAGAQTTWLELHHVGAAAADFDATIAEKVLVAGRAWWFYLGKLLLPVGLSFIYPRWQIDAVDPAAWLYPLAVLAAIGALWSLRGRIGRGPAAAALYYTVAIFPALGWVRFYFTKYSWVQDHFQYLAGIGPIVLCSAGVARARDALATRGAGRRAQSIPGLATAAAGALLATLAMLTWQRTQVYRDAETLWRDTIARNPEAWLAHNNLGALLLAEGQAEEAVEHLRTSVNLEPQLPKLRVNLGDALLFTGKIAEALSIYESAVEMAPGLPEARLGHAVALERSGRAGEAEVEFGEALRLNPHGAEAPYYLARLLLRRGEAGPAATLLEDLLRRKPWVADARALLAEARASLEQRRERE